MADAGALREQVPWDDLIALGIEGSANKIGVGIATLSGKILSNPRETYLTPPGFGFLPRETAKHHRSKVVGLVKKALAEANVDPKKLSVLCYTKGPGMGAPLSVGAIVVRVLSQLWDKPIVGVNHCVAHIEMGRCITNSRNPAILYVSGGNTQIIAYSNNYYRIFGETLDVAVGNCLDRVARLLLLPNEPAPGWQIEMHAKKWEEKVKKLIEDNLEASSETVDSILYDSLIELPYCVKGMDCSFSGIITKLEEILRVRENGKQKKSFAGKTRAELNVNRKAKVKAIDSSISGVTPSNFQARDSVVYIESGDCEALLEGNNSKSGVLADSVIYGKDNNVKKLPFVEQVYIKGNKEATIPLKVSRNEENGSNSGAMVNVESQAKSDVSSLNETSNLIQGTDEVSLDEMSVKNKDTIFLPKQVPSLKDDFISAADFTGKVCYSLQEHVFSMLVEITERAMSFANSSEVLVVGGVGCNLRLQEMIEDMATKRGATLKAMDERYCIDNGAMVAYTGLLEFMHGGKALPLEKTTFSQRFRTDQVFVHWRKD